MAHLYLSRCYLRQVSPQKAEEMYARAVELDETQKDLFYWISIQQQLGERAMADGDFDAAIGIYEHALEEVEREGGSVSFGPAEMIYESLADVYRRKGDLDKAIEIYETALAKREESRSGFFWYGEARLHGSLAEIYREKGDFEKAAFHEEEGHALERRGRWFSNFTMCTMLGMSAGSGQWVVLFLGTVLLGIYATFLKRRSTRPGEVLDHVRWKIGDVLKVYVKAFLLPLLALVFILSIAASLDSDGWIPFYFAGMTRFVALPFPRQMVFVMSVSIGNILLGLVSMFVFARVSRKHLTSKLGEESPGPVGTRPNRVWSAFLLSCWQLLSVGAISVVGMSLVTMISTRVLFLLAQR